MDKKDWLTTADLAAFLASRRNNDVRVELNGCYVPLADAFYDSAADMVVLTIVEESDDYRIATEPWRSR